MISLTGCLKDDPLNDFASTAKPVVELPYHGMEGFSSDAVLAAGKPSPFAVPIIVNIASEYPLSKDVNVTLAVDDALRTQYNTSGAGLQYEAFPDSTYTFDVKTGTIKAGSRLDTFYVNLLTDKIDFTHNYMLPVKIADASGETVSGNFSIAYLHIIGNPLAGAYNSEWIRYNTATKTPPPAFDVVDVATFLPVDATTINVDSGTGVTYILTFDNTGGVLSNFKVEFPSSGPGSADDAGITITSGPVIVTADPVAGKFEFNFTYLNSAGSARNITDIFTK